MGHNQFFLMNLKMLFSRRWRVTTILVLIIAAVFVRLGFWQIDRLQTRRQRVAHVQEQINAPLLRIAANNVDQDFTSMQYRHVSVSGTYDYEQEVVLRNQVWLDQYGVHHNGVHLLTPLRIEGGEISVLIDRGWIPFKESEPENRKQYMQSGAVTVYGIIRVPQSKSEMGLVREPALKPSENRRDVWNFANVSALASQVPYPLLDIYIQEEPKTQDNKLPYAHKEFPDLTEGAHLGFAFQWFSLAAIVLIGYPIVLQRQKD